MIGRGRLGLIVLLLLSSCRTKTRLTRGDAAVVLRPGALARPSDLATVAEPASSAGPGIPVALTFSDGLGIAVEGSLGDTDAVGAVNDEDLFSFEVPGDAAPGGGSVDAHPGGDAASTDAAPIPPSRRIAVEITPAEGLSIRLELRDPLKTVIATSAGGVSSHPGFPNVASNPGDRRLLSVRRLRGAGHYVLTIRFTGLGAGDEREPNDSPATATPLAAAHTAPEVAGFLATAKDEDWYRVLLGEVADDTLIDLTLEMPSTIAGRLTVLDAAGRKVATAHGRLGGRVSLRHLAPTALASVDAGIASTPFFFVGVRAETGFDQDRRYVLRVQSEIVPDTEHEPNDEPGQASLVGAGATLSGDLGLGDIDLFRLDVAPGGAATIDLEPPPHTPVLLEVLPPGASRWLRAAPPKKGLPVEIVVPPTSGGAALIRLTPGKRGEPSDQPYHLRTSLRIGVAPPAIPVPAEAHP